MKFISVSESFFSKIIRKIISKIKVISGIFVIFVAVQFCDINCMYRYFAAISNEGIVKIFDIENECKEVKEHDIFRDYKKFCQKFVGERPGISNCKVLFDNVGKYLFALAVFVDKKAMCVMYVMDVRHNFDIVSSIYGLCSDKPISMDVSQDGRFFGFVCGQRVSIFDCQNNFADVKNNLAKFIDKANWYNSQDIEENVHIKFIGVGPKFVALWSDSKLLLLKAKVTKDSILLKYWQDDCQDKRDEHGCDDSYCDLICSNDGNFIAALKSYYSAEKRMTVLTAILYEKRPDNIFNVFRGKYKCIDRIEKKNHGTISFGNSAKEKLVFISTDRWQISNKLFMERYCIENKDNKSEKKIVKLSDEFEYKFAINGYTPACDLFGLSEDGHSIIVGGLLNRQVLIFNGKLGFMKKFAVGRVCSLSVSPVCVKRPDCINMTKKSNKFCDCVVKNV